MLTRKNAKAWAVLAIVYDGLNEETIKNLSIESYQNGRESGYAITNWSPPANGDDVTPSLSATPKVAFSENRNSDNIVVYTGPSYRFSMQGNTPDDATYKGAKYFDPTDYVGAARAVLEHLGIESWL